MVIKKYARPMARDWSDHQRRAGRQAVGQKNKHFMKMIRTEWNSHTTPQHTTLRTMLRAVLDAENAIVIAHNRVIELARNPTTHDEDIRAKEDELQEKERYIDALDQLILEEEISQAHRDVLAYDRSRRDAARQYQKERLGAVNKERNDAYVNGAAQKAARYQTQRETPPHRHKHPWHAYRAVGAGGQGVVGVWIKNDANNYISDRIAVKDTYCDVKQTRYYREDMWDGNVEEPKSKVPKEVTAMRLLNGKTDKIVRFRSWRLFNHKMMYRLYLEWCPHGDCDNVTDHYNDAPERQPIPEPAIWHILECLVEAGIVMEQGNLNHAQQDWQQIVHCDIKPENIFLSLPSNASFPLYPTPKLGDFGLVVRTSDNDPLNPTEYYNRGTQGMMAPEQIRKIERDQMAMDDLPEDDDLLDEAVDDWKLNSATNIFTIGLTLMTMMCLDHYPGDMRWDQRITDEPGLSEWADARYSEELKGVLRMCTQYKPQDRITFGQLLRLIQEHTGAPGAQGADRAQGMRTRAQDDDDVLDANLEMWYPSDKYAIYSRLIPE